MPKIYAVSDGSGTTADTVARAALVQFDTQIEVQKYPRIRSLEKIRELVAQAAKEQAIVVHTFASSELRSEMYTAGRANHVPTIDLLGPLLVRLSETLSAQPRAQPGVFKPFETGYLQRIDALDFAVRHDDGLRRDEIDQAEIVLVGVSRTAKTPLSIYLAYRGWLVANLPIVVGLEPPKKLFDLPKNRVIGLSISLERLTQLRRFGEEHPGISPIFYGDPEYMRKEVAYAQEIFERGGWPLVDMSHKSVEEAAAEILTLVSASETQRDA